MFKKLTAIALLGALAGLTDPTAIAGYKQNMEVTMVTTSLGDAAKGMYRAVAESADSTQYIGCSYFTYDSGSENAICYARNADGLYRACSTRDEHMLRAVTSASANSYLYFVVNADGTCDRVITINGSYIQ